jgi:Bacteriophage head to tail connecting protein
VTSGATFPDLIAFATHGLLAEEDRRTTVRWKPMPVGQYWLAADADGQVDTCYREFSLTVSQMVGDFGLESCSSQVQDQYRRGQYDVPHKILHVVEPNRRDGETGFEGQRAGRWDWSGMEVRSVWMESAVGVGNDSKFLRTAGYRDFPVIAPRWGRTQPEDVYGTGPAFEALPDIKQLQTMVRRKLQMIEKQSAPALAGPDLLKTPSQLPGTYTAVPAGTDKVQAIYVPDHGAVDQVRQDIRGLQYTIKEGLYADLWRIITDDERTQPSTAEEVRAKREERLLQLGPVGVNVEQEHLKRVVDRVFNLADRSGMLPPAPPELDGVDLKVEFLSIMSDAQKAQQIPAIERTAAFLLSLSELDPDVLDAPDGDKFAERYAEVAGLPPDLMRTPEGREARRRAKAMQAQAAQQGAAMAVAAKGAKDLAGASLESDNGLTRILGTMSPGASSQAGGGMSAPLGTGVAA